MQYCKQITLKSGALCTLRTGVAEDGAAVLAVFNRTHAQTENLLSYPDENQMDAEQESRLPASSAPGRPDMRNWN